MLRFLLALSVLCVAAPASACDQMQVLQFSACPQQYVQQYAVQQFAAPVYSYQMQFAAPVYQQQFVQSYAYPQQVVVQHSHAQAVVVRQRLGFRGRRALRLQARADRASIRAGLSAPVRARVIIAH